MGGLAILITLSGMAGGWLFRALLIMRLRKRHPEAYSVLGKPSIRLLASIARRHHDTQIAFWRYLWGGKAFALGDRLVSAIAAAAIAFDITLAVGVVLLLWSAGRHA